MNFLLENVVALAPSLGVSGRIIRDPAAAVELRFDNGKVRHLYHSWPDLNPAAAAQVARVKAASLHFLREAGFRVPEFGLFARSDWAAARMPGRDEGAALAYAEHLGFPVVVKPCTLSYSQGVHMVADVESLKQVLLSVTAADPMIVIQRVVRGREYRVVVLDGRVELVFEKAPLLVRGDGQRSIAELLEDHLAALRAQGHEAEIAADDPRVESYLKATGRRREEVPRVGEVVQLSLAAGLIAGGEMREAPDFPPERHAEMIAIAREAGLRYAGIDVILNDEGAHLIEINAYPGNGGYAALGPEPLARVQDLIARMILAMGKVRP